MPKLTAKQLIAFPAGVGILLAALVSSAWFFSFFDLLAPWYELLGVEFGHGPKFDAAQAERGFIAMLAYGVSSLYVSESIKNGSILQGSHAASGQSGVIQNVLSFSSLVFYVVVAGWGWVLLGQHWYSPLAGAIVAYAVLAALRASRIRK